MDRAVDVRHYTFGRLPFSVEGTHAVAHHLRDEFAAIASSGEEEAAARFRVVDRLEPLRGSSRLGNVHVTDDAIAVTTPVMRYEVRRTEHGYAVDVQPTRPRGLRAMLPASAERVLDWNHLTAYETTAKNVVYNLFDYVVQASQLPFGQSHLHASTFEKDGAAVALIAWGGVGKTTAMLKLVLEHGWRYLSDDLALVGADGTVWRSPKKLQVYAYNVENEPHIRDVVLRGRSAVDRASWALRRQVRGLSSVRRRVSAESLFGRDAVSSRANLEQVIYLERMDRRDFDVRRVSATELAERAAYTVLSEIQPFVDVTLAVHSTGRRSALPGVQDMLERTRATLADAFARASCFSVSVPLDAEPRVLTARVLSLVGDPHREADVQHAI